MISISTLERLRFKRCAALTLLVSLCLLFAASSWLSAQPAASPPLKKVSFLLDWYPQAEQGGLYYALVNGLYKQAGLDVTIIPISADATPGVGRLVFGQIQFMLASSTDVMISRARGVPIISVMAAMQHDPKGILVHAESPVKSFADLDGHELAVGPGSAWYQYVVKKYHLTHIRESRLSLNNAYFAHSPDYMQESYVTAEPYFLEKAGIKVRTLLVQDTGFDNYRTIATSDSFLANNKDVVKAFVEATIAGWKGFLNDPAATEVEIKKRNPEMSQGQMDYTVDVLRRDHFIDGDASKGEAIGQINPNRIAAQCQILQSLDLLPKDFDYSKSFDNEFCSPQSTSHP